MYIHMPYNQGHGDPSQYLRAMDPYEHQVICYFTQRKKVEKKKKDLRLSAFQTYSLCKTRVDV